MTRGPLTAIAAGLVTALVIGAAAVLMLRDRAGSAGGVEAEAVAIERTVSASRELRGMLSIASIGMPDAQFGVLAQHTRTSCSAVPPRADRALWPRPFIELRDQVSAGCGIVKAAAGVCGDVASCWSVVAEPLGSELDALLKALPDYSPAQLRRAMAERR